MTRRSLRSRPAAQYVDQLEWDVDEDEFVLVRGYNPPAKFREYESRGDCGLVREMKGEDFTLKSIQENGLTSPIVFRNVSGLGMKLPPSDFSVSDVKRLVGPKREVDVMDTNSQKGVTMTMSQWAKYYRTLPRKKILNIISLEFSCTKMANLVEPPSVVRQLDWVEGVWPREMKEAQTDPTNDMRKMMYPKVQKYCLMSVANCYTDFHLDFGGTSVWYHLLQGEKLFLLIPPSQDTYDMFSVWQLSGEQENTFFADLIEHAQLVRLVAGDTFIMPSGWIHAVYTPSDSLVFGGNFLHSFNIPQQLAVAEMEARTKVPGKFRYPFYGSIHWYTLVKYSKELKRRGVHPEHDSPERTETAMLPRKRGPRWLKEVSVERVPVSQDSQSSGSPDGGAKLTPPHPHMPTPTHPPHRKKLPRKAHISSVEVEGLLLLLKKIQEDQLFLSDVPPSLADPLTLASQLISQLKSSNVKTLSSSKPTGVSLLRRKGLLKKKKSRKRLGQRLKESTPTKLSRVEGESFVAGRPECSEEPLKKEDSLAYDSTSGSRQGTCCEEGGLIVRVALESLETREFVRGDPSVASEGRGPVMDLESPSFNSWDFEMDVSRAESASLSESNSPNSSFSLLLPCTPTSPPTPSQLLPSTPTHPLVKSSYDLSSTPPQHPPSTPTSLVFTSSQDSSTPTASVSTPSQDSLATPTAPVSTPSQDSLAPPTAPVSTPSQDSLATPTAPVSTPSQDSLAPPTAPVSTPSRLSPSTTSPEPRAALTPPCVASVSTTSQPSPSTPTSSTSTPSQPSPLLPTPSISTPSQPPPSLPTPSISTPSLVTPTLNTVCSTSSQTNSLSFSSPISTV